MCSFDKFGKQQIDSNPKLPSWQPAMSRCVRRKQLKDEVVIFCSTLHASFRFSGRSMINELTARNRVAIAIKPFMHQSCSDV